MLLNQLMRGRQSYACTGDLPAHIARPMEALEQIFVRLDGL
jgi:hypothetical protein